MGDQHGGGAVSPGAAMVAHGALPCSFIDLNVEKKDMTFA
jgi:hypothetical protein